MQKILVNKTELQAMLKFVEEQGDKLGPCELVNIISYPGPIGNKVEIENKKTGEKKDISDYSSW